jgi:hypothetical protein
VDRSPYKSRPRIQGSAHGWNSVGLKKFWTQEETPDGNLMIDSPNDEVAAVAIVIVYG